LCSIGLGTSRYARLAVGRVILLFEQSIPCWCCYDLLLLVASTTTTYSEMLTGQLGARGTIPVPSCHFHAAVPCGNRTRRSGPSTLDNDTTATGSAQEKRAPVASTTTKHRTTVKNKTKSCSMLHVDFVYWVTLALLLQNHHDVGLLVFYGMGSSTVAQGPLTVLPGRRSRRQNDVTTTTPHQNYPGRTAPRAGTRQRSIRRRRRALRRIRNTDRARSHLFLRRNTWTANMHPRP
jgi:hypothetical protein